MRRIKLDSPYHPITSSPPSPHHIKPHLPKSPCRLVLFLAVVLSQVFLSYIPVVQAEPIALLEGKATQSAASQLVEGRKYYEVGQFAAAAKVWEQAAKGFAAQKDRLNQAMVLSNLSLVYQQLGQWNQATQAIAESLNLLGYSGQNRAGDAGDTGGAGGESQKLKVLAQALNTQGSLQLALGQSELALTTWQQAAAAYSKAGDRFGITRSSINQAQALKALGLYRRALATLIQVNQTLEQEPDSLIKAASLRSLGTTLQLIGAANQSQQALQKSLVVAQKLKSSTDISGALLSLGNTARSNENTKAAIAFYEQAATTAPNPTTKVQAQLNQLGLLLDRQQWLSAQALLPQIQSEITDLPASRTTIYAQINFAQSLMKMEHQESGVRSQETEDRLTSCTKPWRMEFAATQTKSAFADLRQIKGFRTLDKRVLSV